MTKHIARTVALAGETITLFGYGFRVSEMFSPYRLWEKFCDAQNLEPQAHAFYRDELTTAQLELFLEDLEDVYGNYVGPDDYKADGILEFFGWDRIPQADWVEATYKVLLSKDLLKEGQYFLEQLSSGHLTTMFQAPGFSHELYCKWLADVGTQSHDVAMTTRFHIAAEAIKNKAQRNIDRVGWSIQGVGAGEDYPQYAYTVGLHQKTGYELVIVAPIPFNFQGDILNGLAQVAVEKGLTLDQPFELEWLKIAQGDLLRVEITDVTGPKALEQVLDKRSQGGKIYQVFIGDIDNRLPSELTEPSAFVQPSLKTV